MRSSARAADLFAKGAAPTRCQVEVEMVAVGFVGLRSKHGPEYAARPRVQPAQERALGTCLRLLAGLAQRGRRLAFALSRRAAPEALRGVGARGRLGALGELQPIAVLARDGARRPQRGLGGFGLGGLLAVAGALSRAARGFLLVAQRWSPMPGHLDRATVRRDEARNVDGVGERVLAQALAMALAAVALPAGIPRGIGKARNRTA